MRTSLLTFLIFVTFKLSSQMVIGLGYTKYIGFNTNPILAQVIPFNGMNPQVTTASLMFRTYNFDDNGIRAAYGLGLGRESDFTSMYVSVDNDRRRTLNGNWLYFQGFGAAIKIVSPNFNRATTAPVHEEYTMGLGWHFGVEYAFNSVVSVSTEANLKFGVRLNDGAGFLKIDPPINIIAHFNLYN